MKIFIPSKTKTDILGLWQDSGKIYRDNISTLDIGTSLHNAEVIRRRYEQLAVFYIDNSIGYIWNGKELTTLKNRLQYNVMRLSCDDIKRLLTRYGGLTIYRLKVGYSAEVYY